METITLPSISQFNKPRKMSGGSTSKPKKKPKTIDLTSEITTESTNSDFVPNVVSTSSGSAPNIMKGGKYESILKSISSSDESSVFNEIYLKSKNKTSHMAKKSIKEELSSESSHLSRIEEDQYSETSNDKDKDSELLSTDDTESVNFDPHDLDNTSTIDES